MTYRRGPERIKVKTGKRYAVIGAMVLTAACNTEIQATPTQEIFSTQPHPTEVIPTPSPSDLTISGFAPDRNEVQAAFGEAVGAGGPSFPPRKVFNNSTIQGSLNRESLAPVLDSERGIAQVVQVGGERVCFPNMPEVLFNPDVPSGQDDWLQANGFIISYGEEQEIRFKGLGAVSLKNTDEDIICVNTVVNNNTNPFGARRGKVLNVLMNSTTGEIYGTLPGIYGAEEDVRFDFSTGQVVVGNTNVWYIGDKMAGLVAESEERVANREQVQSNINAFLNGELTFNINDPNETDLFRFDRKERLPLGWHHIYERDFETVRYKNVDLHSVYLGGFVKDNNFFYILGTENSREEKLVYLSVSGFLDNSDEFPRLTQTFYERMSTPYPIFLSSLSGASQRMISNNELPDFMSDYLGKPIFTLFSYGLETDVEISALGLLNEAETPFAKKWLDGDSAELIKWLEGTGDKPSFAIENISQLELTDPFKAPLISMLKLPRVDK